MQDPSPGNGKAINTRNITRFSEASIAMIGQCSEDITMPGAGQSIVAATPTTTTVLMDPQTQAQFEADKRAVYKHPLFPLLALLFEKCELATQSAEVPSSESFNMDIQAFVQHQERDRKPFFSDDPDVDGLMVKAIQVLRIHLLELEKVQELCKDFCNRYISCLKNKMQSENLLRPDYPGLNNNIPSSGSSTPSSGSQSQPLPPGTSNGSLNNFVLQSGATSNSMSMNSLDQNQLAGTMYQMVHTPQGLVAQPIQIQGSQMSPSTPNSHVIHGSTPLSQIGAQPSLRQSESRVQTIGEIKDNVGPFSAPRSSSLGQSGDEDDDLLGKKKQKRGVLPKHATSIMRSWLFQHIVHPYPTEEEKKQIAAQTNLTLLQVNNWFINARRRILQPMLDASNPDTNHKSKKSKTQSNRPVQRFWPENIASIQPQVQNHGQNSPCNSSGDQGPSDAQAGTSGMSSSELKDHVTRSNGSSGHSSHDGNLSHNCTDNEENKTFSVGSLEELSIDSMISTDDEKDDQ